MSRHIDIWEDTIAEAAEECSLTLTPEQLATAVAGIHDNWDLVHYTPPASDHYEYERRQLEQRHKQELAEKERYANEFRRDAEETIRSLRIRLSRVQEELAKHH